MTGCQRLKVVLSAIYWAVALASATGVFFMERNQEAFAIAANADVAAPPPSPLKLEPGRLYNDAEFLGAPPKPLPPPPLGPPLEAAGIFLGIAAVPYAIAAALWWAFAGFRRPQ